MTTLHLFRVASALGSLAAMAVIVGCASKAGSPPPHRPGQGIAEYRQVAAEAERAMRSALNSLAAVSAQSNRCPPAVLSGFSAQVRQLQVDSLQVRARSLAIQARGDEYFKNWHEHLVSVKDPQRRALVEERRPALQEAFGKVKQWSQEGHQAFQPLLSNLRKARNALEKDPDSLDATSTREWLASARTSGEQVERCLASIQRELDAMSAMISSPGSTSTSPKAL